MIRSAYSATDRDPSIALFQDSRESFRSETENKENFDGKQPQSSLGKLTINNLSQTIKLETSQARVLSYRERNAGVFRFSNSEDLRRCGRALPVISVQYDDEVFSPSELGGPEPASSKLLQLTPSTAHTPLQSLIPSPNIDLGVCCSTPNRIKLEREGLTSTEKLVLGRGAFGTVVLGRWRGVKVAIKVMEREEGGRSARRRNSLEGELHAKSLEHQHIVKIFDVHAQSDRHAVIIMEYVGSRNLHRLLVELQDSRLGRTWLLQAATQVSLALAHCHSKAIVHLDVKPANVLVTRQGVCKLGDFGCSVSLKNASLGMDHSLVGTPGYQVRLTLSTLHSASVVTVQAPEFLRGEAPSTQCDVYSLGILLWQLDSWEVPFTGPRWPPHVVMYQVVASQARPPAPTSAHIKMSAFTSLYQSCWAHQPVLRPSTEVSISSTIITSNVSLRLYADLWAE